MEDSSAVKVSLAIHTVAGIIAGYVSLFFEGVLYSVGAALAILIVTGFATEFILKKKGIKWWMTNGGILYILVWLVSWVYFFNLP